MLFRSYPLFIAAALANSSASVGSAVISTQLTAAAGPADAARLVAARTDVSNAPNQLLAVPGTTSHASLVAPVLVALAGPQVLEQPAAARRVGLAG